MERKKVGRGVLEGAWLLEWSRMRIRRQKAMWWWLPWSMA
jgi:hypothetical protein